jgi:hypothetical protein
MDAQRDALEFMKKADGMNLRVKQLIDAFAPGMEVFFNMRYNSRIAL